MQKPLLKSFLLNRPPEPSDAESDHKSEEDDPDSDFEEDKKSKKKAPAKTPAKSSAFAKLMGNRSAQFSSTKKKPAPKKRRATKSFGGGEEGVRCKVDPSTLPVLTKPQDMFDDIVLNYSPFAEFCKKLGRPLRVATMCSGTESPMLALAMLSKAVEAQTGCKLEVEHAFSCEIEPFKQAYIERNFSPPILFRDIRELGNEKATTAYGGLVDVPGNCDLLVAGTSCVDYSNLNNQQKGLDDGGESGQTFTGMMDWVDR